MSKVMDRPNGDIVAGQFILITAWCGRKAFVKRIGDMMSIFRGCELYADENDEDAVPNRMLFGDVIEIVAVDWPNAIAVVHGSSGNRVNAMHLDLREFECKAADPAYVQAVKRAGKAMPKQYATENDDIDDDVQPVRWWQFWKRSHKP